MMKVNKIVATLVIFFLCVCSPRLTFSAAAEAGCGKYSKHVVEKAEKKEKKNKRGNSFLKNTCFFVAGAVAMVAVTGGIYWYLNPEQVANWFKNGLFADGKKVAVAGKKAVPSISQKDVAAVKSAPKVKKVVNVPVEKPSIEKIVNIPVDPDKEKLKTLAETLERQAKELAYKNRILNDENEKLGIRNSELEKKRLIPFFIGVCMEKIREAIIKFRDSGWPFTGHSDSVEREPGVNDCSKA